jgi:hypothetical protein
VPSRFDGDWSTDSIPAPANTKTVKAGVTLFPAVFGRFRQLP